MEEAELALRRLVELCRRIKDKHRDRPLKRSRGTERFGKGSIGGGWREMQKAGGRNGERRRKKRGRRKEGEEGRRREGAKRVERDRKRVGLGLKTRHITVRPDIGLRGF